MLTTVYVDGARIGTLTALLTLSRCRGVTPSERVIDAGFHIVERGHRLRDFACVALVI